MTFVAAKCPQCGGDLQLDPEKETGFCMHCGSKIVVRDAIKAVCIDNSHMVDTWMEMGDLAAESGNNKEAYDYYTKVVEAQPNNWRAIFKRGKAAGWQSTLVNVRLMESATSFAKAINLAPWENNERETVILDSVTEITSLAGALIALRAERFEKWPDDDEANIKRYEQIAFLENKALESCSWDYEIYIWGQDWYKELQLSNSAKQWRRGSIALVNKKIADLSEKTKQKEIAENQEKERIAREEEAKRLE